MAFAYTRRLAQHVFSGTREHTILFVVPAGLLYVVRDIAASNGGPTAADMYLSFAAPGQPEMVFWRESIEPASSNHQELRQAFNAGDVVYGNSSMPSTGVVVTGYVFTSG